MIFFSLEKKTKDMTKISTSSRHHKHHWLVIFLVSFNSSNKITFKFLVKVYFDRQTFLSLIYTFPIEREFVAEYFIPLRILIISSLYSH